MGLAGDLSGGLLGKSSAEEASDDAKRRAKKVAKKGEKEYRAAWGDIESWMSPYLEAGTEALKLYKEGLGTAPEVPVFNAFDFDFTKMEDNPAYQFVRDQGLQAVDRIQAKNRALTSGNRLAATVEYAEGLASTEYDKEWQRQFQGQQYNNSLLAGTYGMEADRWGTGRNELSGLMNQGVNTAGNMAMMRNQQAGNLYDVWSQEAADKTSASLIPVQEKQNFLNNAWRTAAAFAPTPGGGGGGGGGGGFAPYSTTVNPGAGFNRWGVGGAY